MGGLMYPCAFWFCMGLIAGWSSLLGLGYYRLLQRLR